MPPVYKKCKYLDYEMYVNIDQGIYKGKMKVAVNEKRKKLHGFSFSINIPNFKAFLSVFKLTKNPLFLKSDLFYSNTYLWRNV